jgi:hypothetical protein
VALPPGRSRKGRLYFSSSGGKSQSNLKYVVHGEHPRPRPREWLSLAVNNPSILKTNKARAIYFSTLNGRYKVVN